MAELAGKTVVASSHSPTDDCTATNPGTERDHQRVVDTPGRPDSPFRDSGTGCIVVNHDGETQLRCHAFAQWEFANTGEMGGHDDVTVAGHETGDADADGVDFSERSCKIHDRGRRVACRVGRDLSLVDHAATVDRIVDDHAQGFRSPDVDPQTAHEQPASKIRQDSQRDLSSVNVCKIRFSARRLTKPGSGITRSIERS